jgi:hypothetical protein
MAEPKNEAGSAERRLNDLLAYPREDLGTELKSWLDLSNESNKANLAQAMLALANYGGGYIIIGFAENGGTWIPATPRPANLDMYNQDIVNGIVQGYAEPPFHCSVYHQAHPQTGETYPIIVVPGESKVPIRAKKDGPNKEHVKQFSYYIRRPGPKSETPQSAQEWDELIGRCVRSSKQDLIEDFRRILLGFGTSVQLPSPQGTLVQTSNPQEETSQRFDQWISDSRKRWEALVAEKLFNEQPSRYSQGTWTASYVIDAQIKEQGLGPFLEILRNVQGHETGWPVWWVPNRSEIAPYPNSGLIECWLKESSFAGPAHSDFWRASPKGMMFLLRGYQEDEEPQLAGKIFDVTLPIWRVAECLLHAQRLAKAFDIDSATIIFQLSWSGLSNRILKSWANPRRIMWNHYQSKQDSTTSNIKVSSSEISTNLPEIVSSLTRSLYESFDFFEAPQKMIEEELATMRGTKVS